MNKFLKTIIFSLALTTLANFSLAFVLPANEIKIGDPVYIEETDTLKNYAVFLPFEEPTKGQVCASISGEELSENNNLKDYGTCFINDSGIFTIVEIEEPFSSSYEELKNNEEILQEDTVTLSNDFESIVKQSTEEIEGVLSESSDSEGIISDLGSFIQEAQDEISRILASLTDTQESSETTESQVLGLRTFNIMNLLQENHLVIILIILIAISTTILISLIKKIKDTKEKNKDK
ncbi:MAG TPA: hypothetical protein P5014_02580 [Patescibacteria group bacterium]|nr:hypothetical protein [bacterium]HRY57029.1 hypothetical protein [Patescibacteria group bacterium]